MAKKLRFISVVASSSIFASVMIPTANYMIHHADKFTEEQRYEWAMKMVRHMAKRAQTKTDTYGRENLPDKGGYILFSNHQGKYDALGIMISHIKPLSMLWEEKSADRPMARQVRDLAMGKTIRLNDYREQIHVLNDIAKEVAAGRRFLIFPEGGYKDNRNFLQEFKSGCFMAAIKSKQPIIPVAIYDSWRSMDTARPGRVTTQVHYLKPIMYEEYMKLKKKDLCELVRARIEEKMQELRDKDPRMHKLHLINNG